MTEEEHARQDAGLTSSQQAMVALWEQHMAYEFETHSVEDTMATMVEDPSVTHLPVLTGGTGADDVRAFYARRFIPVNPPDTSTVLISRTIGQDRIIDELIFRFTHTMQMDWMLPGIAPTGRRVEAPLIALIEFREGKVARERIYWDQASVLAQLGLLDAGLPVLGSESARWLRGEVVPLNSLIDRAEG